MNIYTRQIIEETADKLSSISEKLDDEPLTNSFFQLFNNHYALINYIESDAEEIIEITKIKKDKSYLKKYISSFEQTQQLYKITGDDINYDKMALNIWLFKIFMNDIEEFSKIQSGILYYPK